MKKTVSVLLLLSLSPHCFASERPFKNMVINLFCGSLSTAAVAGSGYGIKKAIDYSLANYSLDFPPVVTHTSKSQLSLIGLSILGTLLVGEKLYYDKTNSCEAALPFANPTTKLRAAKALDTVIKAGVAYAALRAAGQSPFDATLCAAVGLGVVTCLERNY